MQAPRDENFVPAMLFVGSDGLTYPVEGDEVTGRIFADVPGGSGTVTSASVVSANGFAGTVATATTTPAITLSTTITGILKGNGTAISAAGASDVDSILPTQTGNNGKYLTTNGTVSSWATIAGGGDVTKVGTPVNNQIGVWTGDGTLEGDADLTFTGTQLVLAGSQTITVADTANVVGLTINQNDVTNSPYTLVVNRSAISGYGIQLLNTDATGGSADIEVYSNSATPAANDVLGGQDFYGNDSGANKTLFASIKASIIDPTNASEDGAVIIGTVLAGSGDDRLTIGGTINGIKAGSTSASGVISSNGNQDLILQTGNATTGSITITDGANGNISISPNGTGNVNLNTDYVAIGNGSESVVELYADATDGSNFYLTASAGSTLARLTDTSTGVSGPVLELYHNSASPAASDVVGELRLSGEDSGGGKDVYARLKGVIVDPTSASEDGKIVFGTKTAGTEADELELTGAALYPTTNNGLDLGTSSLLFNNTYTTAIELGAASDTTISRSAAGVIAVEGVVIPSISSTNTLTNKRVTKRVGSTTSSATPTINTDNVDAYHLTAQTVDITSFTTNLSGTPTDFQQLRISVTGTAARAITWGASFANGPVALPTTTVTTTRLDVLLEWDSVTSKWRCMASGSTV